MNNNCKRWTRQDKLSEINRATLDHYYALLFTAERKRDLSKRDWLPEFAIIVKVIESICRLEGIKVDYDRIGAAECNKCELCDS